MSFFSDFWRIHPALFVGLHLLLGAAFALHGHWLYPIFFLLLWSPFLYPINLSKLLKLGSYFFLSCVTFAYAAFLYPEIQLPSKELKGTGLFSISNLKVHASPFQKSYLYQGTMKCFESESGMKLTNLPCTILVPLNKGRIHADRDYLVNGKLSEKENRNFLLKLDKNNSWLPVKDTFSFAEWRYTAKEKISLYLKKVLNDDHARLFLNALLTGDVEERSVFLEFGHFGLQHILAISGFHFGLLAAFCTFFLRLFLSPRNTALLSLIFLSGYCFFIGNGASVQRAWIMIFIFLFGRLCNLRCSGLNALGIALIIEILIDPLIITKFGFQLSFLCTFAILLFYSQANRLLGIVLRPRSKSTLANMNLLHQHGYLFSATIRNALALNVSVHLFTLPVMLYYFHKFPLLSLAYNLFVPLLAACSFFLLLISMLLTCLLPPIAIILHHANDRFTSSWLQMIANSPAYMDFFIRIKTFPFVLLAILLFFLTMTGIHINKRTRID
ncbi:MAG TPA: ComEC/Rec2 family competence protein [Rhabdochlamydiaceae bacterium]|nr:ComEC/Rec2 family competence protein [Rhabdochlamydiaceae bacterium]